MVFQAIAPMSAPKITCGSITSGETMPLPSVFATCSPKTNIAAKLHTAAKMTAWAGFRTRVDTTVAMAFAASCRPLRKSKASARMTSATRTGSPTETVSIEAA
jgi:hypothetical protein